VIVYKQNTLWQTQYIYSQTECHHHKIQLQMLR